MSICKSSGAPGQARKQPSVSIPRGLEQELQLKQRCPAFPDRDGLYLLQSVFKAQALQSSLRETERFLIFVLGAVYAYVKYKHHTHLPLASYLPLRENDRSQVASCILGARVGVQKLKCSTKEVVLRNVCEVLAAIRSI